MSRYCSLLLGVVPAVGVVVAAIVTTGTGLGTGVGQALAGFLGPTYGWRFPFLIVSIPGMVCSLLLLCIKDPPRGQKEAARIELDEAIRAKNQQQQEVGNRRRDPMERQDGRSHLENHENDIILVENKVTWKTTKEMITTPTVALAFIGAAPGALPFGFGSVFLNDYLAEDRGMTVEVSRLIF